MDSLMLARVLSVGNSAAIFRHLDFAAMGVVEARYDRFSLFSDLLYTKLSAAAKLPLGFDAEVATLLLQWTPTAAYSLIKADRAVFDVMARSAVVVAGDIARCQRPPPASGSRPQPYGDLG